MQVNLIGRHAGGVTLDVTGVAGPISVTVQDRHLGLPTIPGFAIAPRPAWMAPLPLNDVADSTIVRKTYTYQ
jgi:hypothetical protein